MGILSADSLPSSTCLKNDFNLASWPCKNKLFPLSLDPQPHVHVFIAKTSGFLRPSTTQRIIWSLVSGRTFWPLFLECRIIINLTHCITIACILSIILLKEGLGTLFERNVNCSGSHSVHSPTTTCRCVVCAIGIKVCLPV